MQLHVLFKVPSLHIIGVVSVATSETMFVLSRPINLSQRASPATFTVMTRCAMARQIPHRRIRCCDAQMKVLSAEVATAQGRARQKPLMLPEEKMVSWEMVVIGICANLISV